MARQKHGMAAPQMREMLEKKAVRQEEGGGEEALEEHARARA